MAPRAACLVSLLVLAACGAEDTGPVVPPVEEAPPWDDDTHRLGHCDFTEAPVRPDRPDPGLGALRAGYGRAILDLPIGTPLGAYGGRVHGLGDAADPDERHPRWANAMTASVGLHDALRAEALALAAGDEPPIVLMRIDAPFVTENVVFAVEDALAPDGSMRGRILVTASHSHASWGAWQPTVHLVPGADRPSRALFDRAIASLASAAERALEALEPARLGIAIDTDFDPNGEITKDRRNENDDVPGPDGNLAGAGKDPHAWALRVDRASGEPMVALVNLAIHGTVGGHANPLASTDVTGRIARSLSSALGIPVMHLQGAAGDVTPSGETGRAHCVDELRCLDIPRMESLGARAAAALGPLVTEIVTGDTVGLELVTRTFPVGRGGVVTRPDGQQLYYLPPDPEAYPDTLLFDDDGKARSPFDEFNTVGGAGLCGDPEGFTFAPLVGSSGVGPYHACIDLDKGAGTVLSLFEVTPPPLPFCDSVRATGAALRIAGIPGGDRLVIGIGGEPTAPYVHYLRSRSPAPADDTLVIGYTNEYSGYMLTAEDWLTGGYECSTNIWGPREGEQILEELVVTSELAWTPEHEDPRDGDRLETFDFEPSDAVQPVVTTDHGTLAPTDASLWWPDTLDPVPTQPTATVPRAVGAARFAWYGGDPAVDRPTVTVEREIAGTFEPVVGADGTTASSHEGVVVVTYTPAPLESATPTQHLYAATWQTTSVEPLTIDDPTRPFALPTGTYRLCATGQAVTDASTESYTVCSAAFDVVVAPPSAASSAVAGPTELVVSASLGPAPGLRALRDGVSDGEIPLLGPWSILVTLDDASTMSFVETPDADGTVTLALDPAVLAQAQSVEVRDPVGNGGVLAVR